MVCTQKGIVIALILSILVMVIPPAGAAEEEVVLAENSISRLFDHVVVKGNALKGHLHKPIPQMRLYAFIEGKMSPVPFQIDEVTEDGDWVLPHKSPYLDKEHAKKSTLIRPGSMHTSPIGNRPNWA